MEFNSPEELNFITRFARRGSRKRYSALAHILRTPASNQVCAWSDEFKRTKLVLGINLEAFLFFKGKC